MINAKKSKSYFVVLILYFSVIAIHASAGTEKNNDDCFKDGSLMRCSKFSEYKKSDKKLNLEYKKLISLLDKKNYLILKKAEQKWLHWRERKCAEVLEKIMCGGGAICSDDAHDQCFIDLTNQRTNELIEFQRNVPSAIKKQFNFSSIKE